MQLTMQKKVVLGLQHTVAMFGATVLVPLLTGLNPSVALIAAGVGTLLFHLVTKQGIQPDQWILWQKQTLPVFQQLH